MEPIRLARPKPSEDEIKARKAEMARSYREWWNSLGKEGQAEYKANKASDRRWRQEQREIKKQAREQKRLNKRELDILNFMMKTDVRFYHHQYHESMRKTIKGLIDGMKDDPKHNKYHPYIWNYQGEGHNYLPKSQMECIWSSREFETIYDVPLDGTYVFQIYDSGERGLGSFNRITAVKVDETPIVPKVNPGGMPPITV
jgi:hypothetical protein